MPWRVRVNKSLEIGGRTIGREVYVNSWLLEKLWKVAEAICQVRDAVGLSREDAQEEAWRNICKLASWMAENPSAYDEESARAVFEEGEGAMLSHLEELLGPILEGGNGAR